MRHQPVGQGSPRLSNFIAFSLSDLPEVCPPNSYGLALGARVIDQELALEIVRIWLDTPFEGGRHLSRIRKIDDPS